MSLHNEIEFENDICRDLAAHGWLYAEGDAQEYDTPRALFPPDVLAWVQATQPQAWQSLTKNHGGGAEAILHQIPISGPRVTNSCRLHRSKNPGDAQQFQGDLRGTVSVSLSSAAVLGRLPHAYARFRKAWPAISLRLVEKQRG